MKFTNTAPGPRAVHVHGANELGGVRAVWIEPGETVDIPETVKDSEIKNAEAYGVTVEKRGPGRPAKDPE